MKKILIAAFVGLLGFSSCSLNTSDFEPVPVELSMYGQNRFAHIRFMQVVDKAIELTKNIVDNPTGNAVPIGVTLTPTTNGSGVLTKLVVDFSDNEQEGFRGSMVIDFTGEPFANGSSFTITPNKLTLVGMTYQGNFLVGYSAGTIGKQKLNILVEDGKIVDVNNVTMNFSCNFNRELNEGNPLNTVDDFYVYTGGSNGTTTNNLSYTVNILTPLEIAPKSVYFQKGKVSMFPAGYVEPFTVEFGVTNYINQVRFTYQGVSKIYNI